MAAESDNFGIVMAENPGEEKMKEAVKNLQKELHDFFSKSSFSDSFIFRAPHHLRKVNAKVFEPQIFSIGPYHRDKDYLKAMKIHKVRYLSNFLERTATPLETFAAASVSMEEGARNCYDETVKDMSSGEFVTMMVIDGLFIIELICSFRKKLDFWIEETDDIFKQKLNLTTLAQDLLLLENQLPFFVLDKFLSLAGIDTLDFIFKIFDFFSTMLPNLYLQITLPFSVDDIKHLLAMVHDNGLVSSAEESYYQKLRVAVAKLNSIRSATELLERGIKFKRSKSKSLFDFKFKNGVMLIPTLIVNHDTERILRNLIAYEQLNQGHSVVMDYARLMDCLINHADDVALLSDCGIIDNWLGSYEDVATMFNEINDYVYLSTDKFYYSDIFFEVNEHCNRRLNMWKKKLRKKYFHTPWDWVLMSIFAATILLALTLVQTAFSILAYFRSAN